MKITNLLVSVIIVAAFSIPFVSNTQAEERPTSYVSVDCIKSMSFDYTNVETEIWQALHQERVRQGKIDSWALYQVLYGDRSKCDFYTVTTLLGQTQLNADPSYEEVFQVVHPDRNYKEAMALTWASRQRIATQLWELVDSTEIREHRFAVVNTMNATDADAYERMESQVFKAGHQELLDGGHRSGWGMYALVSPLGTAVPYNYSTVDFSNHLNPVPMAEAMMSANPDRDLDAMQELLQLREHINSQTWALVAATTRPIGKVDN